MPANLLPRHLLGVQAGLCSRLLRSSGDVCLPSDTVLIVHVPEVFMQGCAAGWCVAAELVLCCKMLCCLLRYFAAWASR